jgi:hypothetical protein
VKDGVIHGQTTPEAPAKGNTFALQLHAGKPMWTEFKHIRLKELAP